MSRIEMVSPCESRLSMARGADANRSPILVECLAIQSYRGYTYCRAHLGSLYAIEGERGSATGHVRASDL